MAKKEVKRVIYAEPEDYFPKEVREMFDGKKKTAVKKTTAKKKTEKK